MSKNVINKEQDQWGDNMRWWLTLVAVLDNYLIEYAKDFKVFNNVWVLIRDEDEE